MQVSLERRREGKGKRRLDVNRDERERGGTGKDGDCSGLAGMGLDLMGPGLDQTERLSLPWSR